MYNRISKLLILLFIFASVTVNANADLFNEVDHNNNLRMGNDYIVIVVNEDENGQGRFAIETTGGAPFQQNDNNKPLVYGRPKPWTSYTTVWLDEEHYIFGGETGRRAGANGKYGEVVEEPHVVDDSIITTTRYNNEILVEQILTIVKSSTTGLYDSVQIKYRIENIGEKEHKVGLRVVLDTMLGKNDGAPFRLGDEAVTTDKLYYKKQLPQFWQAFDSISNPTVTSQGTFTGQGVTPPDQIKFADWGSMADGVWDFDFKKGEEFLRKGEFEIDSAVAMYWVPEIIEPGQSMSYITNYGLGGITVVPGLLSLGVTSPAEVTLDSPDKNIPIIAYLENTSEITAKDVTISINLPDSLTTDEKIKNLGNIESGDIKQIVWHVTPIGSNIPTETEYTVKVEAKNTDSNQVTRQMEFIGPPNLETEMELVEEISVQKGKLTPNPFTMETTLYNSGGSPLYDTSVEVLLPPGLVLASKENLRKYPGDILPGEKINIKWKVKALNIDGQFPLAIDIKALHEYQQVEIFDDLALPQLNPLLFFELQNEEDIEQDDYISIDAYGENLSEIDLMEVNIKYDPEVLKPIFVSRGTVFLKDEKLLPWRKPDISNSGIIKLNQIIPSESINGIIATLHFKVLKNSNIILEWESDSHFIGGQEEIEVNLENLSINL
ncbi:MAG: hypothetical protein ACOC1N_02505 [Bacillota bacterium]